MPKFYDQQLQCRNDFCNGTVLWSVRQQDGQWYNAQTHNPPNWMCNICRSELDAMSDEMLKCSIPVCDQVFVWKPFVQLKASRTGSGPPHSPLCSGHHEMLATFKVRSAPCGIDGCEQSSTITPLAQLHQSYRGSTASPVCAQCRQALNEFSPRELPFDANEAGKDGLRRVREHLGPEKPRQATPERPKEIVFLNDRTGREEHHSIQLIRDFLYDRMNDWKLPIREIIEQIGDEPVFIIAKTGVGKTVTVPTKILLSLCANLTREGVDLTQKFPQVYVVEPRIPICTMMMAEMNDGYQNYVAYRMIDNPGFRDFLIEEGLEDIESKDQSTVAQVVALAHRYVKTGRAPYDPRHFNLYGCITSATGKINANAPILFVTTGIMESLTFEDTELDPKYHRIIIDEAHVTIEANPAIELGIALARKSGIKIDYMSATVDPATLSDDLGAKIVYAEAQRFPIHLRNLRATVGESILGLVENFLLTPNESWFPNPSEFSDPAIRANIERIRLHLMSQDDFQDNGTTYPGLQNRPQGMLVIVNSHRSENSDTHRIADIIARADFNRGKTKVHTLRLASPVVRDPAQKLAFDRLIRNIEDENGRYVIVATNVVEMGLTFSSIDYVVTMDSEFDTECVDGGQMTSKVALGVNGLYQRIGRAGRVRPGMAFIAQDFGASYSELDDNQLAAGLEIAPIRYPLAKGSFLKLALYSFRERIPDSELKERIADLNLPSRIQDKPDLWSSFLAERSRLQRVGIADGDSLTPAGEAALTFIGLDDMDFAKLLAQVIERYRVESDLAVIFTVIAASSELAFSAGGSDDLMAKRFFLTNPKQLSALEIFHESALGIPVASVFNLVNQNEGNPDALYDALRLSGVDDQLCSDICACVRAGYKLDRRNNFNNAETVVQDTVEKLTRDTGEGDDPTKESIKFEDEDMDLEDEELPSKIERDLAQFSTEHTLAFERAVVPLSDQSELINIYRIYRHFFNNYFSRLKSTTLGDLEASELRRSMEDEATKLQVSMPALNALNRTFNQLARHVGIHLGQDRTRSGSGSPLTEDEEQTLRDSIIRDLLFEREGNDERFDVCLRFYKGVEDADAFFPRSPRDCEWVVRLLGSFGFRETSADVYELWNLIVKEAQRRYGQQRRLFTSGEMREALPPMSRGLEIALLRIVREAGYHRKLSFSRGDFGFTTVVRDQAGSDIKINISQENNPLATSLNGKENITVLAKLTPSMIPISVRNENDGQFSRQEKKDFCYRTSHY